ncbi:MAG: hypothetical protein QW057_07825 [Candidatus Bathyarchaeia archaeon]
MSSMWGGGKVWPFSTDEQPPYPSISAQVANPEEPSRSEQETLQVDTGFSGPIALGAKLIETLALKPIGRVPIRTAAGYTETLLYRVLLTQRDLGIANRGITAIGTVKSLLGRSLLEPHRWLLDFQKRQLTLLSNARTE